jgi:asparagine synthase (glutamine-hydrolysing)
MCGIAGFIDFDKKITVDVLKKQCDTIQHRGPDGEGQLLVEVSTATIGLGHRRLSIIDLTETGSQPMQYLHWNIIFNGEIYNYAEITKELQDVGHTFLGHSDTEMILHAFEEWGVDVIKKFIGMFSFVMCNTKNEEVFFVRDRAGVKPLFYFWNEKEFIFGSELKALLAHPSFEKKINIHAAASYMQYGYVPTPHCIWQNTNKLKPGHYLKFTLKNKSFTTVQYWNVYDAYNKPKLKIDFKEAISETEKLLQSACNYRMVADVPVGIFLSGGYDSSTVAALLQKESTQKLKTFTIGMPDAGLNEAPYAKDIAKHLGTDHTEYYCTEKEALDIIPDLPFNFDEPFADSSAIPTTLVSKIARQQVTVALSADAGDEVFAGYNRYEYMDVYGKKLKNIPGFALKTVAAAMEIIPANKIPVLNKKALFHGRYEKVKKMLQTANTNCNPESFSKQFSEKDITDLFINNIFLPQTAFSSKELQPAFYNDLSYMMAIDYQNYLVDDILQKVDRATMTVSLEGREPFLDHRVIEWAAQLPNKYKYVKGNKKYILKEINKKYIPTHLMDRPKMGFGIPIEKWLKYDLKELVEAYINEDVLKKQNIFNATKIIELKNAFYNGRLELANKVWTIVMFQLWYNKYIN